MTFSLYQSAAHRAIELIEAARMYHLSAWQRFLAARSAARRAGAGVEHDDVGVGRLVFRRRSEAITVSGQMILLPGIGSYIATAIEQRQPRWRSATPSSSCSSSFCFTNQLLFRPLWRGRANSSATRGR